jgi:hypothetical protein
MTDQSVAPPLQSLADWYVGQTTGGVPKIRILLTDKNEARAWAAWLFTVSPIGETEAPSLKMEG